MALQASPTGAGVEGYSGGAVVEERAEGRVAKGKRCPLELCRRPLEIESRKGWKWSGKGSRWVGIGSKWLEKGLKWSGRGSKTVGDRVKVDEKRMVRW
eukprot:699851-Rhodomonas_salina.1